MPKIYSKKNYYMRAKEKIPKCGMKIFDKNNNSIFSIYRSVNEDSNFIFLYFTKNYSRKDREFSEYYYNNIEEEDYKSIFSLARDYAIENNYNIIIDKNIAYTFDIQNFISYGNEKITFMTHKEIEQLNSNNINVYVKMQREKNGEYTFYHSSRFINTNNFSLDRCIYVVSKGDIIINNIHNSIMIDKKTNDYTNIINLIGDKETNNNKLLAYFSYNNDGSEYKISNNMNKNIVVKIPVIREERKIPLKKMKSSIKTNNRIQNMSITKILISSDELKKIIRNHKTTIESYFSSYLNIFNESSKLLQLTLNLKKQYPEFKNDLNNIDKIIDIHDNIKNNKSEKDSIESDFKTLKKIRKKIHKITLEQEKTRTLNSMRL